MKKQSSLLTDQIRDNTSAVPAHMSVPDVQEHYWGFEILETAGQMQGMAFYRGMAAAAALVLCAVATLVAVLPSSAPVMLFLPKALIVAIALCAAVLCLGIARPAARMSLQVDEAEGELRLCTASPYDRKRIIARYGLDAVKRVSIVAATDETAVGQVLVVLRDGTALPAGRAAMSALEPLKHRLALASGTLDRAAVQVAEWSGPLDHNQAAA